MEQVRLEEIENIYEYERHRPTIRPRMLALKQQRSLPLGPQLILVFENREMVRYYIQEAARADRILQEEALQQLIEEYNPLLPSRNELSTTLYLQIERKDDIKKLLHFFQGITKGEHLWFQFDSNKTVPGHFTGTPELIQPAYQLTFSFDSTTIKYLQDNDLPVSMVIDHRTYYHRAALSDTLREILLEDLRE